MAVNKICNVYHPTVATSNKFQIILCEVDNNYYRMETCQHVTVDRSFKSVANMQICIHSRLINF